MITQFEAFLGVLPFDMHEATYEMMDRVESAAILWDSNVVDYKYWGFDCYQSEVPLIVLNNDFRIIKQSLQGHISRNLSENTPSSILFWDFERKDFMSVW